MFRPKDSRADVRQTMPMRRQVIKEAESVSLESTNVKIRRSTTLTAALMLSALTPKRATTANVYLDSPTSLKPSIGYPEENVLKP